GRCWTRSTSRRATRTAIPKGRRSSTTAHFRARRQCALPVRSLSSSVVVWPDRAAVESALRLWAEEAARIRPELVRVGYFGSYARDDWGVGSDLDVVLVVAGAGHPFARCAARWGPPPCSVSVASPAFNPGRVPVVHSRPQRRDASDSRSPRGDHRPGNVPHTAEPESRCRADRPQLPAGDRTSLWSLAGRGPGAGDDGQLCEPCRQLEVADSRAAAERHPRVPGR